MEFPFVEVPKSLGSVIGKPDKGTRMFRASGRNADYRKWIDSISVALAGNLLPSNWVPDYVGVSRAAVHQRAQSGKLTAFVFSLTGAAFPILKLRVVREQYVFLVRSECDAWREEILFRRARSRSGRTAEDYLAQGEDDE